MKFYQEITLLEDENIRFFELWSKLYKQLHLALADIKNQQGIDTIGVCFPQYRFEEKSEKSFTTLGSKLRVFAPQKSDLEVLDIAKWLHRLSDYAHIKRIAEIGNQANSQVLVQRYQSVSKEKQAQTFAKHKAISLDEALVHCQQHKQGNKNYPFIRLKSEQTQLFYPIFIRQIKVDSPQQGRFNTYGLSGHEGATVPLW